MNSRRIKIFDTTLRDGEQAPGIALRPDEKVEIAEQLERLGVDVIEAGFAASSPGDFEGVRAVAQTVKTATVASLCRANAGDIDIAAAALEGAPHARIHVFLATSAVHMEKKLRLRPDEVVAAAVHVGGARRRHRLRRRVLVRGRHPLRSRLRRDRLPGRRRGGRDDDQPPRHRRLRAAGGVRRLHPLRQRTPVRSSSRVTLSAHCHDDLGLAVANSLAALDAGVEQVECTVNGIGERAGNAALEEIVMALRVRGATTLRHTGVDPAQIRPASRLVERLTGCPVPPNKAVVGANAFAHEAGIHQDGMLKDASTYQIIDPEELGLAMSLPLGKHSGRHAFVRACEEAGLTLDGRELEQAFARFKTLADGGERVSIHELFEEVTVT